MIDLYIPFASAAWRMVEPLPAEAFERPLQEVLDTDEILELLERSFARHAGRMTPAEDCVLRCQRARFFLHAHGRDAARREAALIPDAHPALAELKDEIERLDPAHLRGRLQGPCDPGLSDGRGPRPTCRPLAPGPSDKDRRTRPPTRPRGAV